MTLEPLTPMMKKCITLCIHRNSEFTRKNSACYHCAFYDDKPNYREDVKLTTTKLDFFTAERYPQYAQDKNNSKSKA